MPKLTIPVGMADLGQTLAIGAQRKVEPAHHPNVVAPGKRPRVTLTPSLALTNGRPFLCFSVQGGDTQDQNLLQFFLNMVEFGMNIQRAIEAPRWSTRSFPASPFPHTMYPGEMSVEERISNSVRIALQRKGHKVKVSGPWSLGSNAGIVLDLRTGVLSAGADPRVEAYALAR